MDCMNIEGINPSLLTLATSLYGSRTDLERVSNVMGEPGEVGDIRRLLRSQCNLVQDPISGMWMQLVGIFAIGPPTTGYESSPKIEGD